ncbi:L,D-transpeptidase family protein [Ferrimonas balearica]|uniref:L,D-transpeptidase family protein n=1 Tax=Ferrimonas balearica TaxID=44012 RepID=UPI001C990748|nr:L,D-transpeptidase family protein [Ferrimonas balearica]MBY5991113.1 L,D-transpeptidase family protein [Ferrimonas balearica]
MALLAAADLDPRFAQLSDRLADKADPPAAASALHTEAYLLIQAFWDELYLRPPGQPELNTPFHLNPAPGIAPRLARDAVEGRLYERVLALEPAIGDYLAYRNQVNRLSYLARRSQPEVGLWGLIEPGERHAEVPAIRTLLHQLEDYPGQGGDDRYDDGLVAAVQQFQRRHGLAADGVIGPKTRRWLTLSYPERSRLLARAMVRQAHDRHFFASNYLLVNIPDYRLHWVVEGEARFRARVVVGMPSRRTPRMHSQLRSVVVNPTWNVPRSILHKDLLPKILVDGRYVAQNRFEVLDYEDRVMLLSADELSRLAYEGFPYRLRQTPGDHNALGRYKFHLANSRAIYLHDTPKKRLFDRDFRALSSGCVRVEDADLLANLLLQEDVSYRPIQRYLGSGQPRWLKLGRPLDVYLVYWSAWMESGRPHYRDDIYDLDLPRNPQLAGVSATQTVPSRN